MSRRLESSQSPINCPHEKEPSPPKEAVKSRSIRITVICIIMISGRQSSIVVNVEFSSWNDSLKYIVVPKLRLITPVEDVEKIIIVELRTYSGEIVH